MTGGIDEAGRGPVLGPLVLAAVGVDAAAARALRRLGVCDSKRFGAGAAARHRRADLAREVRARAVVAVEVASAAEVDAWVARRAAGDDEAPAGLDALERALAERALAALRARCRDGARPAPAPIHADGARLFGPLARRHPELVAEDRADGRHLAVAAASIVAKAERDRRLEATFAPYAGAVGPLAGGGYPNAATARFLRAFADRFGRLPPETRHTWRWAALAAVKERLA